MKKLIMVGIVSSVVAACISGCTNSDTVAATDLTKSSVLLSEISQNIVTYELTVDKSTHTDMYCPKGILGVNPPVGTWEIVSGGNELLVNNTTDGTSFQYVTTNGLLEVNKIYPTNTGQTFKVTKIETTVCL